MVTDKDALAAAYRERTSGWREDPEREFWDTAAIADGLDEDEMDRTGAGEVCPAEPEGTS